MGQKSTIHYAIVDLETTGGRPDRDKITEIGIVLHNGREITDSYSTLINPGVSIPPFITRITGINQEMVDDAPFFHEVAKDIILRLDNAVFVAHNARFDYHFLKEAYLDLGFTFHRPFLCTVRMSRKAFPGLSSYSLENLIRHFSIPVMNRHRALDDALATAQVFQHILNAVSLPEEGQSFSMAQIRRERSLPTNLPPDLIGRIPNGCGVYYFLNGAGDVIYVGKSVHMRKRLAEHLRNITRKAERLDREIASVEWVETGSELYACLLESYEIKRLQPSVNKAQRVQFGGTVLIREMTAEGYLRIRINKDQNASGIINHYGSARSAQSALAAMVKRFSLCRHFTIEYLPQKGCFEYHVGDCQGACLGQESRESYNERVHLAAMELSRDLEGSFFLLDDGPQEGVQAVIAVRDGQFAGMGFLRWEDGHGTAQLEESVRHYPDNPEARRIIRQFMTKRRMVRIEWPSVHHECDP